MSQEKKLDYPFLTTIPYEVLADKDISPGAKVHFGILCGLCVNFGYCFATTKQLSELQQTPERTIERWLEKLEKKGYISRETKNIFIKEEDRKDQKQSFKKTRRIFITGGFVSKKFSEPAAMGGSLEPATMGGYKYKTLNHKHEEEEGGATLKKTMKKKASEQSILKPGVKKDLPTVAPAAPKKKKELSPTEQKCYDYLCSNSYFSFLADRDKKEAILLYGESIVMAVMEILFERYPSLQKGKLPRRIDSPYGFFLDQCKQEKQRRNDEQ